MVGSEDKPLTRRECDRCQLKEGYNNMESWIKKIESDVETIESRNWKIAGGIILLLITGIANMVLFFFARSDSAAIAQEVIKAIQKAH